MFSKEQFTTVTPLSKALAMIVFITLPFAAFFLGMSYGQQSLSPVTTEVITTNDNVSKVDTSSWITYHNAAASFEINIPENWGELSAFDGSWSQLSPDRTNHIAIGDKDRQNVIALDVQVNNSNFQSIDDYIHFTIIRHDSYTEVRRRMLVVENGHGERITALVPSGSTVDMYVFRSADGVIVGINNNIDPDAISNEMGIAVASTFRFEQP